MLLLARPAAGRGSERLGKVTYQRPLPGGYVVFISQAAGNTTVSAPIHETAATSISAVPVGSTNTIEALPAA